MLRKDITYWKSLFIGGSIHKEIVIVERFEYSGKVALARNPYSRVINRRVLLK